MHSRVAYEKSLAENELFDKAIHNQRHVIVYQPQS